MRAPTDRRSLPGALVRAGLRRAAPGRAAVPRRAGRAAPGGRLAPCCALLLAACLPSPLVPPRAADQLRRGYAHLAAGDTERAEVAFAHALELAPDLAEGWNGLGVAARVRGDLEPALRRFTRAVRLAPALAEGHANLGEALLAAGRGQEAEAELREALRLDPDLAAARQNLARALLHLGLARPEDRAERWAEARRQHLHLLETDPGSAAALGDLAFMDHLSGRPERAEAGWRQAAALAPSPAAFHGLCLALAAQGRCGEALEACDRCLALAPGDERCRLSRRGALGCAPRAAAHGAGVGGADARPTDGRPADPAGTARRTSPRPRDRRAARRRRPAPGGTGRARRPGKRTPT